MRYRVLPVFELFLGLRTSSLKLLKKKKLVDKVEGGTSQAKNLSRKGTKGPGKGMIYWKGEPV